MYRSASGAAGRVVIETFWGALRPVAIALHKHVASLGWTATMRMSRQGPSLVDMTQTAAAAAAFLSFWCGLALTDVSAQITTIVAVGRVGELVSRLATNETSGKLFSMLNNRLDNNGDDEQLSLITTSILIKIELLFKESDWGVHHPSRQVITNVMAETRALTVRHSGRSWSSLHWPGHCFGMAPVGVECLLFCEVGRLDLLSASCRGS